MEDDGYLTKIKKLLKKKPVSTFNYPLETKDYTFVVKMWIKYRKEKRLLIDDHNIRTVFQFHLSPFDHIICYFSKGTTMALLLCKINGKYINMLIPAESRLVLENSLLATYV